MAKSYLEQFVDAVEFLGEFDKSEVRTESELLELTQIYRSRASDTEYSGELKHFLRKFALDFVPDFFKNSPYSCHIASDQFVKNWQNTDFSELFGAAITIGTLCYNAEPVYSVTKDTIRAIISEGPVPSAPLEVHVWITFPDMTILDLSIVPTLITKGTIKPGELEHPVVWREGQNSPLSYTPVLHHQQFCSLVGGIMVLPNR